MDKLLLNKPPHRLFKGLIFLSLSIGATSCSSPFSTFKLSEKVKPVELRGAEVVRLVSDESKSLAVALTENSKSDSHSKVSNYSCILAANHSAEIATKPFTIKNTTVTKPLGLIRPLKLTPLTTSDDALTLASTPENKKNCAKRWNRLPKFEIPQSTTPDIVTKTATAIKLRNPNSALWSEASSNWEINNIIITNIRTSEDPNDKRVFILYPTVKSEFTLMTGEVVVEVINPLISGDSSTLLVVRQGGSVKFIGLLSTGSNIISTRNTPEGIMNNGRAQLNLWLNNYPHLRTFLEKNTEIYNRIIRLDLMFGTIETP